MVTEGVFTRQTLLASGFLPTYSGSVPFGIHSDTSCMGFIVTPMKGTTFGCLSLFHTTASLQNACATTGVFQEVRKNVPITYINLLNGLEVLNSTSQGFDANFLAIVNALPYIGKPTRGDRFITNFGMFTKKDMR